MELARVGLILEYFMLCECDDTNYIFDCVTLTLSYTYIFTWVPLHKINTDFSNLISHLTIKLSISITISGFDLF